MVLDGRVLAQDEADLVADVDPLDPGPDPEPAGPPVREPALPGAVPGTPARRAAALARWRALLDRAGEATPGRGEEGPPDGSLSARAPGSGSHPAPGGGPSPGSRPALGSEPAAGARSAAAVLAPPDLAWLAAELADDTLRDAVLLTLLPAAGSAPEDLLAGHLADPRHDLFSRRPDRRLLEQGRALLAQVARCAPPGHRAQALAGLAWISWWSGAGARARLLAQRALADQPGHRLATLVDRMLVLGVPPEWTGTPEGP
jgi:hypothetical protein